MMFAGHWRYAHGYVRGFVSEIFDSGLPEPVMPQPDLEDPEVLLSLAQQEMREMQAKNRERTVQAITQKNNLQAKVENIRKEAHNLRRKADLAHEHGDHEIERQLLAEVAAYEKILAGAELCLASAIETVGQIKDAMRREEERIRAKTVQVMALKTQWKQHQISSAIEFAAADALTISLKPVRLEVQALVRYAQQLNNELQDHALRALRNGNRDLARALLTERVALQSALSAN